MRPRGQAEADVRRLADHRLLDRAGHVDPAGALRVLAEIGVRRGGRGERGLELCARPVRVLLREQRRRPRHVRGGHRRAGQRRVARLHRFADRAVGVQCRHDVHARCGDVRLQAAVAHARAPAGEPGQLVVAVHRADGQRCLGRTG